MLLGYLLDYSDYWTQAATEQELKESLADIYKELNNGTIPNVRRLAELEVSWNRETWLSALKIQDVFLCATVANMTGIKIQEREYHSLFPDIEK